MRKEYNAPDFLAFEPLIFETGISCGGCSWTGSGCSSTGGSGCSSTGSTDGSGCSWTGSTED